MNRSAFSLSLLVALSSAVASAQTAAGPGIETERTWTARFDDARAELVEADYAHAEADFRKLAKEAPSPAERDLANQLADIAAASELRRHGVTLPSTIRSTDELWVLYANAFVYGLGSGAWFALQTQPKGVGGLFLPVVGFTALAIGGVALADALKPLPYGVPQAVVAGLQIGLGEGIWAVLWQKGVARSHEDDSQAWRAGPASTVIWVTSTVGAVTGGFLGAALHTTPGRASFVSSTSFWTGSLFALTFAALTPDTRLRAEHAFAAGDIGYNAGLVGGMLLAPRLAPSIARVRWLDIGGLGGGLLAGGLYSAISQDAGTPRGTFAVMAGGTLAGLGIAWALTTQMPRDVRPVVPAKAIVPTVMPVVGGVTVGIAGEL